MLSEEVKKAIIELQKKYPEKRSALIPALHLAQSEIGYLPMEVQEEIAALFDLDPNDVNGVVTFYDMFFEKPVGKHLLHICKNASCMLRGADELMSSICHKLQINPGETTVDHQFTIIPSECLGACDLAPMMIVDEKAIGPVNEENIDQILRDALNSPGHPSPVTLEDIHG